ncbi:MAG TPA: major facilitator superfamily domain-containing protein 6 [Anaerolineales bacterium]
MIAAKCARKRLRPIDDSEDPINKFRLFAFNFLIFAGFALASPFLVLYFQSLGFSGTEIGLLAGIAPLITFCGAPFWTGLADASHRHRLILTLCMIVGIAGYIIYPFLRGFAAVMLVSIILNFFFAPVSSFADNATMFMLAEKKEFYGRIRLGGTIGYAIAAPLAGVLVGRYGFRAGFWSAAAVYFVGLLLSRGFIHAPSKDSPSALRGMRSLLANPRWILFLIAALASGLALSGANSYFFPYMKELGSSTSLMGIALSIGTITEIPVLFFGHRLLRRLQPHGLFMIAMGITSLRLLLFAASSTPAMAVGVQLLNGFTFPMMWLAGVAYANRNAPTGMTATAQGLFGAMVFGVGAAVGGFLGGPLLQSLGGRGLYLVFGLIVLAVTAIVALIETRLPSEQQAIAVNP